MKCKTKAVCAKAMHWLQRRLLFALFLLAGSQASAQVIETINETGGTISDPGLKIEILADGTFRVFRLGLSETYEGTDDPRGITALICMSQTFTSDPRQVKQVTWGFISPKSGLGTPASPWKVQMVGNIISYRGTEQHTIICTISYVKDEAYFILDYTVACISDIFANTINFYLAEHAVLGATSGDWSGNSVCTRGLGPDYPGPYGTIGVYRDVACGSYPIGRAHVFRMKDGFTSYMATDAAGMMNAYIPESGTLANIYNNTYDGTENGILVHKQMGTIYGGTVNSQNVYTARILSGYGSTMTDFDGITGLDKPAVPTNKQLTVEFVKDTASGLEGDIRHSADNLKIKVYNGFNTQTISLTSPLYVPVIASPAGANPGVVDVDYECKRGILIPPGSYNSTGQLISVDTSVMILGNTALQNDRTVAFTLDNSCNNNLVKVNTSKNVLTYTIRDDESKAITLTMPSDVDEGQNASGVVSLPSGVLAASDITVTLTRKASSTASASDVTLPSSVVIKQNTNSATFTFQAVSDKILEYQETLDVQADATVLGAPQTTSAAVNIKDRTYDDPANRVITMRPVPGVTVTEPYTGGLQFSLPAGVTTDIPINIVLGAMHADPQSTASASDYTIGSTTFAISSGNSVTIPFTVLDDNLAEGTEKLHVTATTTDALSRAFDFTPYDILILDDDANALKLQASAGETEMTEGGASVTFTVSLPAGTTASADIPLTITLSGQGTAADISALPDASFKIPAGANSASFTLSALTDNLVEGDESLTLNGNSSDFTVKPYTITIKDATWNDPNNRKLQLTISGSPIKEGASAALKVGFVNNVIAGKPIVVNLSHNMASVASATDYSLSSTTITIPAGQQEVTVPGFITAQTDLILEKRESFTLDGASSDIPGLTVASASGDIDDATGDAAVNKIITIAAQQTVMDEGTGYTITYSLPAGITTEVPIHITAKTGAGSTAADADYTFGAIPPLDKGTPAVSATINITADDLLEPDETLVLDGTTTDLPGMTFTTASVTLKDKDYVAGMPVTMTVDNNIITEGSTTGAMVTLSLPAGKKTTYDIPVTITKDAASTASDGEHTALPTTVIIKQGTGSVTFPAAILANSDNLLEDDETLIINQSAVGFAPGSITITIKDGSNPHITVQPQPYSAGNKVAEGNSYTVRVALPAGITPYKPFTVTVSAGSASTAAVTDYTGLPATITFNPGENFKDITLSAISDNIIEPQEMIRLKGAVTGFTGLTVDSLNVLIDDVTSQDPSNLALKVVIDSTTLHEGSDAKVTIGFVKSAITAAQNITISLAPDAAFTAGTADYSGVPASVTLNAGTNQMQLTLHMVADNLVEGTEQLKLKATVASPYTVASPAAVTIPEAPVQVVAVKTADAAEPATNGAFVIKLSSSQMAGKDVNVTFKLGGTAGAADWEVVSTTAVIKAGSNSVTIPVKVKDDKLVEGDETVTLTLQTAKMGSITFPVDAAMQTVVLKDDENNAPGRAMTVEKLSDAAEPSQNGAFRIRFSDPQLTVMQDVHIAYSVSGSAVAGTDYQPVPGTATIPAGQNGVAVNIVPIDDQLVEDTEFVHITLQNVTSSMTGITWPLAAASQTNVPILDNDTMKLDLFSTPATVMEGGQVQITIKSASVNTTDIPVALKVVHDPARTITTSVGSLNGNGDTLTVMLPAGSTEYTFTVTCFDNNTNDDEGFVFLQIVPDPAGVYAPGLASEINVVVDEDDPLELSFNAPEYRVNEGNTPGENTLMVEVKLSRASSRPVTLPYLFYKTAGVSFIGTAVPGVDYDSIVKPIEIAPGELVGYIPVPIIGDSTFERNDTFSIRLQQPSVFSDQNVPTVVMPDSAICIIVNDDPFCPTCDTDGDGIPDGKEDRNGNGDPTDDDADGDGIPNYLDLDSDNDGVPDSIEGWITDGRWVNNNGGKIRVHPAISPNGDGMGNDAMYIENIEKYPKNDVVIFNRWGGTVYKTTNYDNQDNNFKGLNNGGKEVTDGSYFYLIHIYDASGKAEQYTGFIVIKRK